MWSKSLLLGLLLLFAFSSRQALADTIHVPADQPTIQAGIDAAAPHDIVLVAPGVYTGTGNKNLEFRGKDLEVRSESGPEVTIIDCEGSGRGLFLIAPLTAAAVVDGFTIRNGNGNGAAEGGGAIVILACSPTISNLILQQNTAPGFLGTGGGGAIACYSSFSELRDCKFVANSTSGLGGGVITRQSRIALIRCEFIANETSLEAGGVALIASVGHPEISQCAFVGNRAFVRGAIYAELRVIITDSAFIDNVSSTDTGGVYVEGSSIERCIFRGNRATQRAGGLEALSCTITDCTFSLNVSGTKGGGAFGAGSVFTRCLFSENSALEGGGVYGGGTFESCTFVKNSASTGSGISSFAQTSSLTRTIIAFGAMGEGLYCLDFWDASVSCCDIYGNEGGDWVGCISGDNGEDGNIAEDPLFCNAAAGDFSLCSDSPCAPEQSACELIGSLPVGCGSCTATAIEPTTWGRIKAIHHR